MTASIMSVQSMHAIVCCTRQDVRRRLYEQLVYVDPAHWQSVTRRYRSLPNHTLGDKSSKFNVAKYNWVQLACICINDVHYHSTKWSAFLTDSSRQAWTKSWAEQMVITIDFDWFSFCSSWRGRFLAFALLLRWVDYKSRSSILLTNPLMSQSTMSKSRYQPHSVTRRKQ